MEVPDLGIVGKTTVELEPDDISKLISTYMEKKTGLEVESVEFNIANKYHEGSEYTRYLFEKAVVTFKPKRL